MQSLKSTARPCAAITTLLLLTTAIGCGESPSHGVELHPVTGTVWRGGEPLPNAVVRFYPVDFASRKSGLPIPKGKTDQTGRYTLRSFDPGDGAPAGQYAATVSLPETIEDATGRMNERDRLNRVYSDPKQPAAVFTIVEGQNTLAQISLE